MAVVERNTPLLHWTTAASSHLGMVLTRTCEVVPVAEGRMQLGTWQGIFLFEHRRAPHRREVVVAVVGV